MADYRINLGVKVNTDDIRTQINKFSQNNLGRIKVNVDKNHINSQLNSVRQQIQNLNNIRIRLNISNIAEVQTLLGNLRTQIQQLGSASAGLGAGGNIGTNITNGIRQAEAAINNTRQGIAGLGNALRGLGFHNDAVDVITRELNELGIVANNVRTTLRRDGGLRLTVTGLDQAQQAVTMMRELNANGLPLTTGNWRTVGVQLSDVASAFDRLISLAQQMRQIDTRLVGLDANQAEARELTAQLDRLGAEYNELYTVAHRHFNGGQLAELSRECATTTDRLSQLRARISDTQAELARGLRIKIADGTFANDISNIETRFNNLSNKTGVLQNGINAVRRALSSMSAASDNESLIRAAERYQRILKTLENQLRINERAQREANTSASLNLDKQKFSLDIANWLKNNSAAAKEFGARIQEIQAQIRGCDKTTLSQLKSQFSSIKKEAMLAGKATQTFGDKLKNQFAKYSSYFSVATMFMWARMAIRDMLNQVVEIDSAMTELKKVTNETGEAYNKFLTNAASKAKEVGATIDGFIKSTTGFARLGYSFEDSQGLAEVANIYAVVGDEIESVEGATQSLISTMAAFKEQQEGISNEDFAMSIVDKFNEIGNNFAISSGGIGDALTRSASSLAAANNTLDESIALITAANTVVQNPETVGTAFKTISMRIRGAKTELEEAGLETDGMVESTAKLREEILALTSVDIMDGANQFKSTYAIMDELAAKWKDLTDIQQATVTELIAGKRQGNIVSSLMTNFDVARDALETSLNSSGSAMAEHAKWSESLEARLNKLKSTWQSLAQTFMSSDFLKNVLDFVIALVNGLDKLAGSLGTFPTLIAAFAAGSSLFKNGGFFKILSNDAKRFGVEITNTFSQIARSVNQSLSGINLNNGFRQLLNQNDIVAVRNYANAINHNVSSAVAFERCMAGASDAAKAYVLNTDASAVSTRGFIASQQALTVSTLAESKSLANAGTLLKEYHSGCRLTGMSQTDFANAVRQTNPHLATAMTSTNSVRAGMVKYTASLIGAKAATLGLRLATTALNAAIGMGVGLLVSMAISSIMKLVNAKEELSEKVDELTSKFKEQHSELKKLQKDYDTSNESSMVSKYGKLSKGVDNLGRNVSLTADEYSEYQSIVNSIADQIPSLVSGYDEQGNAILSCKGNVEELTAAYEKLIHAQNQEILTNSGRIEKDFANTLESTSGTGWWSSNHGFWKSLDYWTGFGNYELKTDTVEVLKELLNADSQETRNELFSTLEHFTNYSEYEIRDALEKANIDIRFGETPIDALRRTLETDPSKIQGIVSDYYTQFAEAVEQQKTIASAKLSEAFDISNTISGLNYGNISEEMQAIAYQVVNSFDYDFLAQLSANGETVEEWVTEMLNQLNSLSEADNAEIEAALNLQTQFNGGEISYGEYVDGLQNAENLINGLGLHKEVANQIKLSLGLTEKDGKWIVEEYETLLNRLTSEEYGIKMKPEIAENFLKDLSASELAVAVDLIASGKIDLSNFDASSLREYIEKKARINEAMSFTIAIDVEAENVEALNTAMVESVSAVGLSAESVAVLKNRYSELESEGYNLSSMFEETSNGIHINKAALSELEQAYAKQKLSETNDNLKILKNRYDELTEEINNCRDASDRASLYKEQESIIRKINDLGTLAAQYEGLTSAYNIWQNMEESGSERDMYEGIIEGFENVKDEISRGWADDGTIKFLELLTGKTDLAGKSGKELKEIYDGLDKKIKDTTYSVKDFFTVDSEGNSTSTGVHNFLDAIDQLEKVEFKGKDVVKRNKEGNIVGFDFKVVGGDEAIAEALGISEELVQIMVRAADDAGFVVTIDGDYTRLADLKTEAETARDALISLKENGLDKLKGTYVNFDFNAEGDTLVEEQEKAIKLLDKFKKDGKIDLNMEGAQEALDIAEYLTVKIDDLTEPKYMQIDVSTLEEDLQNPIEKLQEFERLSKEKHLLTLTGNTEELEKIEADMGNIASEIEALNPEIKAKIGIDDSWSSEEISKKLEEGKIEIPAEVRIDMQMSDDLKDMRLMMMNQLGLVSDNEVKLKIGYDIDDSVVDKLTDEQQEVVVKYLADDKDIQNYSPEQKEALVKYIADGGSLENFTPEEKEAFVNYLVDGGNVEGYTPEDKLALAKYLVDGGDPEKFQPPSKIQKVTAELDSSEVDNHQYEDKTITVWAKLKKTWTNIQAALGIGEINGTANIDGTANVNGTTGKAFKQGSWGTKNSGTALVGELGRETLVRDGKYYTIGNSGAEFIKYQRGDIIFNHKQTEELFKNGKVTSGGGRARALVSGTAFSGGTTPNGALLPTGPAKKIRDAAKKSEEAAKALEEAGKAVDGSGYNGGKNTYKPSGSTGSTGTGEAVKNINSVTGKEYGSKNDAQETIDWIETAISRIEREIDNLDQKASNAYASWTDRNTALASQISKVGDEITLQQQAYDKYIAAANAVGLEQKYVDLIQKGTIDVETITDETLKEKIQDYQTYYEKALECKDAVEELKITQHELNQQKFDNVVAEYESYLDVIDHAKNMLEESISQVEAKSLNDYNVHDMQAYEDIANYYRSLQSKEQENIVTLKEEKNKLEGLLSAIPKGTEAWNEMKSEINDVELAIKEAETSSIEYGNSVSESFKNAFDDIADKFDNVISLIDHRKAMIEEGISQSEARGWLVSESYYDMLASEERKNVAELQRERDDLIAQLQAAMNDKKNPIKEGSAAWYEMQNQINEVTLAIKESNTTLLEYEQTIQQLKWEQFDILQDKIAAVTEEADFMIELMSNDKLYDDNGRLTDEGMATMGLHGQNYNTYMYQADQAAAEAERLRAELAKDPFDLELQERYREMVELQHEHILAAEGEKDAIRDMVEEGIELELDALQERIDLYNEALDSQKDLYDYQKKVKEQTKEIASLEKQMAAYAGDNSEEAKAKLQELKVSLEEAKANLEETEYEKYISDQEKLLDNLYSEYEEILNTRLDNVDALMEDMIEKINSNASTISDTLTTTASDVGVSLSEEMHSIWNTGDGNIKSVLEMYGSGTTGGLTTVNTTLGRIETKMQNMIDTLNGKANTDILTDEEIIAEMQRNSAAWHTATEEERKILHDRNVELSKMLSYTPTYNSATGKWSHYATGTRRVDNDEVAWTQENGREFIVRPSDGAILTPLAKGDGVLTAAASSNIWSMANTPAEFIKDNLSFGATNVPNNSNSQSISQNFENVVFNLPNVKNYEQLLAEMQRDKNFERLILSMSVDRLAGKSSLAKGKAIR